MAVKRSGPGAAALLQAIAQLERKQAAVGFFAHSKYPDGTPVAYVATIQELGHPAGGIPPRPFMRTTADAQRDAWRDSLAKGAKAVLAGRLTPEQMLDIFAQGAAGDIRKTISQITAPPLSPRTIAARQAKRKSPGVSTKPLVDSGLLIQSVQGQVQDK